jgi:hypothetical protein
VQPQQTKMHVPSQEKKQTESSIKPRKQDKREKRKKIKLATENAIAATLTHAR